MMDRVCLIERTFWCYRAGWASLIPVLGLIPGVAAFHLFFRIRAETEDEWNPAGAYLWWGFILSLIGGAESFSILALPLLKWAAQ